MSATAMGVSSAATGLREDSSCGANAVRAPEGFMGCGEPLSKTGDISTACKGGMKDQHKEIFRMPRILTNFENLATVKCCVNPGECSPGRIHSGKHAQYTGKESVSPISANLFC